MEEGISLQFKVAFYSELLKQQFFGEDFDVTFQSTDTVTEIMKTVVEILNLEQQKDKIDIMIKFGNEQMSSEKILIKDMFLDDEVVEVILREKPSASNEKEKEKPKNEAQQEIQAIQLKKPVEVPMSTKNYIQIPVEQILQQIESEKQSIKDCFLLRSKFLNDKVQDFLKVPTKDKIKELSDELQIMGIINFNSKLLVDSKFQKVKKPNGNSLYFTSKIRNREYLIKQHYVYGGSSFKLFMAFNQLILYSMGLQSLPGIFGFSFDLCFQEIENVYIVMETNFACDLQSALSQNSFPFITNSMNQLEQLLIMYDCALSLQHAHQLNMIHGGIHPTRIYIQQDTRHRAILGDYVCASLNNNQFIDNIFSQLWSNDQEFNPPQFELKRIYTKESDIYQLGTVMKGLFKFQLENDQLLSVRTNSMQF